MLSCARRALLMRVMRATSLAGPRVAAAAARFARPASTTSATPPEIVTDNVQAIQEEFTRQSQGFENNWIGRNTSTTEEVMARVLSEMERQAGPLPPGARVLDVATGTGIFARALLPLCAEVVGLDATEAMLEQARKKASTDAAGGDRLTLVQGDAGRMPFVDGEFDVVACRLCIHHFPSPQEQVAEMARVVAPGGRVVIVDLVGPGGDAKADATTERLNHLETLRDPTHTATLSVGALCGLLSDAGLRVLDAAPVVLDNEMDLEGWLSSTNTPDAARAEIMAAVEAELAGDGPATGMNPRRSEDGGAVSFVHKWGVVQALRPPASSS